MTTTVGELIVHQKPLITAATAVYELDPFLAKKFTVESRYGEIIRLYQAIGPKIHLPRAVCPLGVKDDRSVGQKIAVNCTLVPKNAEQVRVIKEATDLLKSGHSFILQAYTGFGKTAITQQIIANIGCTTLIIVPKEDLIDRWREDIHKFLGIPIKDIGFVRENKFDVAGKNIVIGMLHSLVIPGRYPSWLNTYFGLVIADEVHRLGAETFSRAAGMFTAKLRMGLSATPERQDGKEVVFYSHIGPVLVKTIEKPMSPKVLRYTTTWECPRVVRRDPMTGIRRIVRLPHSPGRLTNIVQHIARDHSRNLLICKLIMSCYQKGRKLVVFTDLLEHITQLKLMLTMGNKIKESEIGIYVGGMNSKQRDKASICPIMFATYKMMGEGTNIPWLDACILATPRSEVEQIVGRILREYPDKKRPVVMDLVDSDSPVLSGYAKARLRFFVKLNAEVKRMQ